MIPHQAGMYRVVPLSLKANHLVGLPAAGALVRVPTETPAPFAILAVERKMLVLSVIKSE